MASRRVTRLLDGVLRVDGVGSGRIKSSVASMALRDRRRRRESQGAEKRTYDGVKVDEDVERNTERAARRWRRGGRRKIDGHKTTRERDTQTKTRKKNTGGKNHQRAPRPGRPRRRRADLRAVHGQGAARHEGRDERGHLRRERRLRPEARASQGARRDAAPDDDGDWWTLFRAGGADPAWNRIVGDTRRRRRGGAAETPSKRHEHSPIKAS